jgi:hypothetical protein
MVGILTSAAVAFKPKVGERSRLHEDAAPKGVGVDLVT